MTNAEAAVALYRAARDEYLAACERADAAFGRYFAKRRSGTPTNGAAVSRLENEANDRSIALYSAQATLFRFGIDPWDIDDADGIERVPV